jgi:hypothetical protein
MTIKSSLLISVLLIPVRRFFFYAVRPLCSVLNYTKFFVENYGKDRNRKKLLNGVDKFVYTCYNISVPKEKR